jgi:hypothetical protein
MQTQSNFLDEHMHPVDTSSGCLSMVWVFSWYLSALLSFIKPSKLLLWHLDVFYCCLFCLKSENFLSSSFWYLLSMSSLALTLRSSSKQLFCRQPNRYKTSQPMDKNEVILCYFSVTNCFMLWEPWVCKTSRISASPKPKCCPPNTSLRKCEGWSNRRIQVILWACLLTVSHRLLVLSWKGKELCLVAFQSLYMITCKGSPGRWN